MNRNVESQVAYGVLSYLAEHPDAQDTLEGIMEWWLLEQRIKQETQRIEEALDELVTKGLILERKSKSSQTYYRINRGKYKEIRALLKSRSKR